MGADGYQSRRRESRPRSQAAARRSMMARRGVCAGGHSMGNERIDLLRNTSIFGAVTPEALRLLLGAGRQFHDEAVPGPVLGLDDELVLLEDGEAALRHGRPARQIDHQEQKEAGNGEALRSHDEVRHRGPRPGSQV